MKILRLICLLLMAIVAYDLNIKAQVLGCTDPLALNYNPLAQQNDGSCFYASVNINAEASFILDESLIENSGLILWNNRLWTHNDDSDSKLYALDTSTGNILQTINLPDVINHDWEEISQDDSYIYIGDFGNNEQGNRSDLHILRISKTSIVQNLPIIDTIYFHYSNQTNFSIQPGNTTEFDCEAMIVSDDSIYLFKKQWTSFKSTVYRLPKYPGNHTADSLFTIDVNGLVTGASYLPEKKLIVLCGYSSAYVPFLFLLYDYPAHQFHLGNKRRININLPFHQIEGITTSDGLKFYLTNEKAGNSVVTIPQKLHLINLSDYLYHYLYASTNTPNIVESSLHIDCAYPTLFITNKNSITGTLTMFDISGKEILQIKLQGSNYQQVSLPTLSAGIYFINNSELGFNQSIVVAD